MFNSFHIDGVNAFDENNYEIAKGFFLQAIDKNPEVAESYFYLGKCYFFCDEKQYAISSLKEFIELRQSNSDEVVDLLGPCYEVENMDTDALIKKFIELRQGNSDEVANVSYAFDLLGQCYETENMDTIALRCYEMATNIYPSGASAWNNMGLFCVKSALVDKKNNDELFKKAQIFIKKALEICSDNPVFLHSLASWYEQYIIEVLEREAEDKDGDAVQKNIASNFSYAIHYYRKALSVCHEQDLALRNIISSNLTECLAQYGHHLYENEDYKKAQETYLEALHLDPEHLIVINQIGMSFFKQDCFPEARQNFSSILEKTEDKQEIADAWLNIACTYRLEKEWTKAEEALNQAKRFAPEDSSIVEEEIKLNESKLAALLISTPQTLFGNSNNAPHGTGNKIVETSSFQLS